MPKDIVEKLERLDHLIRIKATGTPKELAVKLNLSERSARNYISTLKDLGAPIKYCRKRKSYYYEEEGRFHFTFFKDALHSRDDLCGGGGKFFYKIIMHPPFTFMQTIALF